MTLNTVPGALKNPRHEAFARALADGHNQLKALELAGYRVAELKAPKVYACKLHARADVKQRVNNLLLEKGNLRRQAAVNAQKMAEVDEFYVLTQLKTVAARCMQSAPVLDRKGEQIWVETPDGKMAPAYTFNAMGANKALELIGRHLAMFTDRKIIESGPFSHLSHDEQRQLLEVMEHWLQVAEDARQGAASAVASARQMPKQLPETPE